MFNATINQTIALAGLYQALALVRQLAWEGSSRDPCLLPSLASVLKIDADKFMDTYGLPHNIQLGLHTLKETLENRRDPRSVEHTRHAISLLYLENRLQASTQVVTALGNDIQHVATLHASRDESLTDLAHDLGRLYQTHISPLGPKIIIEGDPDYLKQENCADMIRALLLAGIRAAVLWRQARGKRLALLFGRNSILSNITTLGQDGQC